MTSIDQEFQQLIDEGFFEVKYHNGEPRYHITEEGRIMHPGLAEALDKTNREEISNVLWSLYHTGEIEIVGLDDEGEFVFQLTELGRQTVAEKNLTT